MSQNGYSYVHNKGTKVWLFNLRNHKSFKLFSALQNMSEIIHRHQSGKIRRQMFVLQLQKKKLLKNYPHLFWFTSWNVMKLSYFFRLIYFASGNFKMRYNGATKWVNNGFPSTKTPKNVIMLQEHLRVLPEMLTCATVVKTNIYFILRNFHICNKAVEFIWHCSL